MDNRLRLTKMEWTASFFLVLCLVSSAQLCTISNNNGAIPPDSNGVILQEIYVKDIQPTGETILELTTTGVNGIVPPEGYVEAAFDSNSQNITVSLKGTFKDYEEVQEKNTIEVRFAVQCSERTILNIRLHIIDTNNHDTKFSQKELSYHLPMPYPPGLEITQGSNLWAYDFDITSEVEVSFEDTSFKDYLELRTDPPVGAGDMMPGHELKPITLFHIYSSAQLNQDLHFNLIAKDVKNGGTPTKLQVAILKNKTISVPDSPMFSKPLYRTSVDCKMGSGSTLEFQDGAIKLPIPNVDGLEVTLGGDHLEYFSKEVTDTEVKIKLNKKVTGVDIKYALLTLKASIPKAKHDGYAVVFVEFLPDGCPTPPPPTTTACPTEPTTTEGTTVDPCSFCPTSTTTECPTTSEVPTTPCDCEHTSTTLSTSTVLTTNTTAGSTTSCPEVSCTPCDCTTTTLSPNTTDATTPSCTPCPEVTTHSSTASTAEGQNTTSGHTITSSGAHSTSHGTNGTHSTTTPGPSHSDTTTHSWFPTGATGTTCVCPEPTCAPCTTETTTVHSPSTKPITTTTNCPVCPVTCPSTEATTEVTTSPNGTTIPGSSHSYTSHTTPSSTGTTCHCDCPEVTCPTPETTTEHHGITTTTNSHGITTTTANSHGSDATTTSGSSHSNTTSSPGVSTTIGSSSATECNCPTCPEVTTVYTTTDSHHTGNIQSSSIITTQQTKSSGTTLSTGHGSSVTPVPTTTGLSSPSQSGSTFSQWISHSTSHESSSSTNCNCPTCPETTSTPPTHGSLSFPCDVYIKQMMAGDIGHIDWVVATPTPPGIINVRPIQYGLAGLTADLESELKISENGELVARAPIQPDLYQFTVTAIIPGVTEEATANFQLKVMAASFCQNGSDTDVIFPFGFMTRTVEESHDDLTLTTFMRPDNLNCSWTLTEKPDLGKVKIEDDKNKKYVRISVDGIDREDDKFNGAVSPTILAEITGSCVRNESSSAFSNEDDDDIFTTHSTLAILIHVTDVNDCAPTFESDKLVVGYPEKKIADVETPESMGTAVAHDEDVGKNAIISYSVSGTDEIIINKGSGQFYPHPNNFQFNNISFKIIASDGDHQNIMDVLVKILEPKYITVLGIEGKTLEDVPKITEMIAESTGLQIGVISARVEKVDVKKEKHPPKEHHLPKEFVPNGDDNVEDPQADDTLYLRLVVYALNGSEPVSVDQFNSSVNEIASESKWKVQDYHGTQRIAAAADSGSEGLLAGVIALSTILVLVILGIVAVFVYRRRLQMRGRGGGSLEKGLVSGNSGSENSSMEGGRDNSSIVFESVTEKGDPGEGKDEFPDGEAPSAERKKSVAFAEETMVIPSEEELEVMPAESGKGNDALGDDEVEEDIRM